MFGLITFGVNFMVYTYITLKGGIGSSNEVKNNLLVLKIKIFSIHDVTKQELFEKQ